ncbi:VOC family protein [Nocardia sp. NPDC003482]
MDIDYMFTAVPVRDFPISVDWYTRLFGREADVLAIPDQETMWQVTPTALLYVLVDPARAGYTVVNLAVADLDTAITEIGSRGIEHGPLIAVGPDGATGRKAPYTDPDGNTVCVIEINA